MPVGYFWVVGGGWRRGLGQGGGGEEKKGYWVCGSIRSDTTVQIRVLILYEIFSFTKSDKYINSIHILFCLCI